MRIAVLSGKGGTGKTFVSVNLAAASKKSTYIDCDVEEPNGYLFFKPENVKSEEVSVKIPEIDYKLCNGCRKCIDFCKFNALAYANDKLIIFEEICHSCGGCTMICPQNALKERKKVVGKIKKGVSKEVTVYTGILNIGEASGIPIIKKLISENEPKINKITVIDCPPGSSCIVIESIKNTDYCILIAEPTIFGVHNLNMVYELVKLFNKPFGVIINKFIQGKDPAEKFCLEKNINILGRIPFDNDLGMLISNSEIVARKNKKYNDKFFSLLEKVKKEMQYEAASNS